MHRTELLAIFPPQAAQVALEGTGLQIFRQHLLSHRIGRTAGHCFLQGDFRSTDQCTRRRHPLLLANRERGRSHVGQRSIQIKRRQQPQGFIGR